MERDRCMFCGEFVLDGGVKTVIHNEGFEERDGFKSPIKCYVTIMCTACFNEKPKDEIEEGIVSAIMDFRGILCGKKPSKRRYYNSSIVALFEYPEWHKRALQNKKKGRGDEK